MALKGLRYSEIYSNNRRATLEQNFDVGKNLSIYSAFALGSWKTMDNLDRIGRSQDVPDANCLIANRLSLNTRTLTFLMRSMDFSIYLILPAALWLWGPLRL
jgi:hypothetical protein